jgi:hypothetical protein
MLAACLATGVAHAQSTADYAIQLQASVQTAPPKVSLSWRKIPGTTLYSLFRKSKTALGWTALTNTADTFYSDASVAGDTAYEYKVSNTGGPSVAAGYLFAGINNPALHSKGTIILIVDTLFRDSCAAEIKGLMKDLGADGWAVVRHDVTRTMTDVAVKSLIKTDYTTLPNVKAVLLAGHIAVPYSGNFNPDAHPDHEGAWPADVFYGDMDGSWTDASINNTVASRVQNKNIPGDGKWDHSGMPSAAELQVSRIDFANMPAFAASEVGMMKSYLTKNHLYKMDSLYISRKAVVDDNFGAFSGEAFAANAWRNFPQMLGRDNIINADLIPALNDSAYQWAYGCGGGSYTSCGGIGATADLVGKNQKGIFTILFGSYFGDWDCQNNFLRSFLCAEEPALTACWAGRPNWYLHHMGLGENIGYSTIMTQNHNPTLYTPAGYTATGVHVALMGDLSLRNEYMKPASGLSVITGVKTGAALSWTASPDPGVAGYYIYRADSLLGTYKRISGLTPATSFTDVTGTDGFYYYMVRPSKLQQTPSGTYYNLGLGITDTATVSFPPPISIAGISQAPPATLCFPNPATDIINIYGNGYSSNSVLISLTDIGGKVLLQKNYSIPQNEFTISENISHLPAGVYLLQLSAGQGDAYTQKIIKQ